MKQAIRIAITPGEPAGIGPELVLKLAQLELDYEIIAIADLYHLQDTAKKLNIKTQVIEFEQDAKIFAPHTAGTLQVINTPLNTEVSAGLLNAKNASYVIQTLQTAVRLVTDKHCHAMTTGPVQKSIINDAGITFSGHTEFIAEITGGHPVMLLTNENENSKLRVALITTHLAITDVAKYISADRIKKVIQVIHRDLIQRFSIPQPCICVCGLNPHAGENGHLGKEEQQIIQPALNELRQQGINIVGPLPADTAFTQQNLHDKDVIVAMYHDQGLPVIKHSGFGDIVNVTLGLPIIRTSVDHGTALDIAGQGAADVSSLFTATNLAAKLAKQSLLTS